MNETLENPEIFHRQVRGTKKYLSYLGVYLYLERKQFNAAKLLVEKIYPEIDPLKITAIPQSINQVGVRTVIKLWATINRAEGKFEVVNQLVPNLEFMLNNQIKVRLNSISGFNDLRLAEIYAAQQNNDDAIKYISKVIDHGHLLNWRTSILYNPIFSALHQDPKFIDLVKRLETEMSRQRTIIKETENQTDSSQ